MQELKQAVIASFDRLAASGALENTIEESLKKCVTSAIDTHLRSYSEFGQQLDAAVKGALKVDLRELGLPGYGDLILKVVRAQVQKQATDSVGRYVEEQLQKLLQPAPAEVKLSKLVEDFIEHCTTNYELERGSSITLHVESESSFGSRWIRMDKEEDVDRYRCRISFLVCDDGRVAALQIGGSKVEETFFAGRIYGFERSLFQMYAAGTKLVVDGDENSINTTRPDGD